MADTTAICFNPLSICIVLHDSLVLWHVQFLFQDELFHFLPPHGRRVRRNLRQAFVCYRDLGQEGLALTVDVGRLGVHRYRNFLGSRNAARFHTALYARLQGPYWRVVCRQVPDRRFKSISGFLISAVDITLVFAVDP